MMAFWAAAMVNNFDTVVVGGGDEIRHRNTA
jgi:hypothetical protein